MRAHVRLVMDGCVDHLRTVWQTAEGLLETIPFQDDPVQTRYNLLVALQELVTNSLRHGYQDPRGSEVSWMSLDIQVRDGVFSVELRDRAVAFDPTTSANDIDPEEGEALPEGGYGLMIVEQVVDRLTYRREGPENVLRIEKAVQLVPDHVS